MAAQLDGKPEPLLTTDEAAAWLSVSSSTIKHMVREGQLIGVRVRPHALRFRRSDVERCLREQQVILSNAINTIESANTVEPNDQALQPLLDAVAELIASAWRAKQAAP